ncbi:MAG: ABC transporter ATP-binding protein [Syntrophales bacterium]|jgi:branched-chain amino acid transport system ATP-binding protein|nr:ABC transporter ATP-binding protein [Syntrophales bacterium]MDY0045351.1 ABC transporter ATP-binding protein [Syntrophales bacterium]
MLLKIENLTKRFGGVLAVNDVTLSIAEDEIVGLIGPNGAGKTTVMNLISGYYKVDSGRIEFKGIDIQNARPSTVCRLGISRTFQIPRPFPDLTALANVGVGVLCGKERPDKSYGDSLLDASHFLEFVGLFSKRNVLAKDLSLFELRLLELARALATTPKLIMLDEVMAGLNPGEASRAIKLVRKVVEEYRVTVFWIEHVMKVVMEATERVIVLHYGKNIASGPPKEIVNNPEIIEIYLGEKIA